jgi:hypothetical protein
LLLDFIAASQPYVHTIHAGVGLAMAQLPFRSKRMFEECDPMFRLSAINASGFHDAFFLWRRHFNAAWPVRFDRKGYEHRLRMQGVGRCIWFAEGGIAPGIARRVGTFDSSTYGDLWSGIGFAATYAGGVPLDGLRQVRRVAGVHWQHLAQGVAFAAKCSQMDGSLTEHQELACRVLVGLSAMEMALMTDECQVAARERSRHPGAPLWSEYEAWCQLIQERFRMLAPQEFGSPTGQTQSATELTQ